MKRSLSNSVSDDENLKPIDFGADDGNFTAADLYIPPNDFDGLKFTDEPVIPKFVDDPDFVVALNAYFLQGFNSTTIPDNYEFNDDFFKFIKQFSK